MAKIYPVFTATIENGKLTLTDDHRFREYLRALKGQVDVIVRKREKSRSNEQNRYYWKVIVGLIAEETGEDKDKIHAILKDLFLKEKTFFKGREYTIIKSTANLKTGEMEEYLRNCRMWASEELSIFVPLPHEAEWE